MVVRTGDIFRADARRRETLLCSLCTLTYECNRFLEPDQANFFKPLMISEGLLSFKKCLEGCRSQQCLGYKTLFTFSQPYPASMTLTSASGTCMFGQLKTSRRRKRRWLSRLTALLKPSAPGAAKKGSCLPQIATWMRQSEASVDILYTETCRSSI